MMTDSEVMCHNSVMSHAGNVVAGRYVIIVTGRGEGKNFECVGQVLLRAEEAGTIRHKEAQQDCGAYKVWLGAPQEGAAFKKPQMLHVT